MALPNPFDKPATTTAPAGGGGGGGNNRPRKPKRPKGRGGGGGAADQSGAVTTDTGDLTGMTVAPDAWMKGQLTAAGYTPDGGRPFDQFVQNTIVDPFVSGWDTYQTNPANTNKTIADYVATQGYGLAPTPVATTNTTAGTDLPTFQEFVQTQTGKSPGKLNKGRKNRLREQFAQQPGQPGATTTVNNPTANLAAFNAFVQGKLDQYSLQQKGIYDAGKDKGGVRWNVFG